MDKKNSFQELTMMKLASFLLIEGIIHLRLKQDMELEMPGVNLVTINSKLQEVIHLKRPKVN